MAFHSHRGRTPICSSIVARNMATLLIADLHPVGGPEIWSGTQISTSISSRIPVHLDEDGCPVDIQSFPQRTLLLRQLSPLWEHGFHIWSQVICRGRDGRPYFMEERELQWANPTVKFLLPEALTRALDYFRILLSSKDHAYWLSLCQKLTEPHGPEYSIASPMENLDGPRLGLYLGQTIPSCDRQRNQTTLNKEVPFKKGHNPCDWQRHPPHSQSLELLR